MGKAWDMVVAGVWGTVMLVLGTFALALWVVFGFGADE